MASTPGSENPGCRTRAARFGLPAVGGLSVIRHMFSADAGPVKPYKAPASAVLLSNKRLAVFHVEQPRPVAKPRLLPTKHSTGPLPWRSGSVRVSALRRRHPAVFHVEQRAPGARRARPLRRQAYRSQDRVFHVEQTPRGHPLPVHVPRGTSPAG